MADLALHVPDLAPMMAAIWQIAKAVFVALVIVASCLSLIAATVVAVFGDENTGPKPDPRKALAQARRSSFLRRGRWVTAEQIREDLDEMEPPFYTPDSVRN